VSDTVMKVSLAMRAKKLAAIARVKRENEKESQDLGQSQTALNKLDYSLAKLSGCLIVYRKLVEVGAPVAEVPDLLTAPQRLQAQVESVGRPTAQFLNARTKDVARAVALIDGENQSAWTTWALQMVDELPSALLPKVPKPRRDETSTRILSLGKFANGIPDVAKIIQFQQAHDLVKEDLSAVESATVNPVLKRFEGGRIRLADLSDEELDLLRADESLRDQLYIQIIS
jgi:hypothetical protein